MDDGLDFPDDAASTASSTTMESRGAATASMAQGVSVFVREYLMFILVAAVIAYFMLKALYRKYDDYQSLATHQKGATHVTEIQRAEGMAAARARQQAYIEECSVREAAAREEQKRKDAEERQRRAMAATAAAPQSTSNPNSLPRTLGGASRDNYRPSYTAPDGGRYRPTGFQRPSGGG